VRALGVIAAVALSALASQTAIATVLQRLSVEEGRSVIRDRAQAIDRRHREIVGHQVSFCHGNTARRVVFCHVSYDYADARTCSGTATVSKTVARSRPSYRYRQFGFTCATRVPPSSPPAGPPPAGY
jgi:hypothetical protein